MSQSFDGLSVLTSGRVFTIDSDTFRCWPTANSLALEDRVSRRPSIDATDAEPDAVSVGDFRAGFIVEATLIPPTTIRRTTAKDAEVDPMPRLESRFKAGMRSNLEAYSSNLENAMF